MFQDEFNELMVKLMKNYFEEFLCNFELGYLIKYFTPHLKEFLKELYDAKVLDANFFKEVQGD